MKSYPKQILCSLCLALTVAIVGCGEPDYYSCAGTVMHEGQPVPHVQITFAPDQIDSTRPPFALSDENGNFEMKCGRERGVPPGTYTIHIEDPAAADGGKTSTEEGYVFVVDRYSPAKSDLKYTADQHRTDYELDLPKTEYTGPPVREQKVRNTTDVE